MALLRYLRYSVQDFIETFGASQLFLARLLAYSPRTLVRPRLVIHQIYSVGAGAVVLIAFSGFFVGLVMALQSYQSLSKFGATGEVGTLLALALFRELGPVITALLFVGRSGTQLASEIGLMRATDQISGMQMMAVDPIRRIIVPRFLAGAISLPLLAMIFSAIGILGGYILVVPYLGVDPGAFWGQMRANVALVNDILNGFFKAIIFGGVVTMIALFEGYNAWPTAEGVGRATTRTVVISSITIFALDYILTAFMYRGI
ncbi:MAG TPA: lipid asymmetry maintenance ABC transporter permease subunit MlaE [Gammaproteobacteria bacterium]|nr:lipid asymmetry maintenance ABC transporter permease subunit MlaE [Gammaproteobacteria bacterium]